VGFVKNQLCREQDREEEKRTARIKIRENKACSIGKNEKTGTLIQSNKKSFKNHSL
jgi:hypothetical protein